MSTTIELFILTMNIVHLQIGDKSLPKAELHTASASSTCKFYMVRIATCALVSNILESNTIDKVVNFCIRHTHKNTQFRG